MDSSTRTAFQVLTSFKPMTRLTKLRVFVSSVQKELEHERAAVAHRTYEDASRKTAVQVFSDRIVVASPGYPPRTPDARQAPQRQLPPLLP